MYIAALWHRSKAFNEVVLDPTRGGSWRIGSELEKSAFAPRVHCQVPYPFQFGKLRQRVLISNLATNS